MPRTKRNPSARARANTAEAASRFFLALYLGLGTDRSIRSVYDYVRAAGVDVSLKTLERYSREYGWVEAAREHDQKRGDAAQEFTVDQLFSNDARQAQLGRLFQQIAIQEIELRVAAPATERRRSSLGDIARIGDVGVRIERLAAGQATEIRQVLVSVYNIFTVEVSNLWKDAAEASEAVYRAGGVEDSTLHDRAYNAAASIFAPGLDRLVQQHFQSVGIRDVLLIDQPEDDGGVS